MLLLLCGCVVQMGFTNPQQRAAALALFRTGQATLSCATGQCLIAWNVTRPTARETAAENNLEDLAALVLAADFDNDLGYYYLGMAASGLGYREAARTYLDRAIQHSFAGGMQTCQPVACDGFDLPTDARIALASLPAATRAVRRRPQRQTAPASASRQWVDPTQSSRGREPAGTGPGWVAPVAGSRE
jgi:hypothetical protein